MQDLRWYRQTSAFVPANEARRAEHFRKAARFQTDKLLRVGIRRDGRDRVVSARFGRHSSRFHSVKAPLLTRLLQCLLVRVHSRVSLASPNPAGSYRNPQLQRWRKPPTRANYSATLGVLSSSFLVSSTAAAPATFTSPEILPPRSISISAYATVPVT